MIGGFMLEALLAYIILSEVNITNFSEYEEYLNELFMDEPSDGLLLDLIWCSSSASKSKKLILDYFNKHNINYNDFGKFLMQRIEAIYHEENLDLQAFSSKIKLLWGILPEEILQAEPFWSMSYVGEPLSWGDVKQTQALYDKMFEFYK